jgi:plastocyanin
MQDTTATTDAGPLEAPVLDDPFVCSIPLDGANTPRPLSTSLGLPVVLRDPIDSKRRFERFGCDVRKGNPDTPDRVPADVTFRLDVHTGGDVRMPDGKLVRFWGFEDPTSRQRKPFPSPLVRVTEGQVVHTVLNASTNTHTIHHHGIEPTPHNDGVGHTSFEVDDRYTYQWRASSAGTYFYHCHKNTVLHFELGMYGSLIVDPPQGAGFVRRGTEVIAYDREAIWIPDDVDPAWHDPTMNHSAGLDCDFEASQHLLRFRPSYFLLSGVPHPLSRTDPRVAVRCGVGDRVLLRLLNAAYGPVEFRLPFDAEVIGIDGHALGGPKVGRYSRPFTVPAGEPFTLSTAQRRDVLVTPDRRGTFTAEMEVLHWVRGAPLGRVEGTITVE